MKHLASLTVDFEAVGDLCGAQGFRNASSFLPQEFRCLAIRFDLRIPDIAPVFREDEMREIVETDGIPSYSDSQSGGAED